MWHKIKLGIAVAVSATIGILAYLFQRRTNQRDRAREKARQSKQNRQAVDKQREQERAISESVNEQRAENERHREKQNAQTDSERRTGDFGSSDRL